MELEPVFEVPLVLLLLLIFPPPVLDTILPAPILEPNNLDFVTLFEPPPPPEKDGNFMREEFVEDEFCDSGF